jgi:hypothetical protein
LTWIREALKSDANEAKETTIFPEPHVFEKGVSRQSSSICSVRGFALPFAHGLAAGAGQPADISSRESIAFFGVFSSSDLITRVNVEDGARHSELICHVNIRFTSRALLANPLAIAASCFFSARKFVGILGGGFVVRDLENQICSIHII